MHRRDALKAVTATFGGLIGLPAWASGWNADSIAHSAAGRASLLNPDQQDVLAAVVEAIIPETDTPGAASLGVHRFVEKMVTDCFEPEVGRNLQSSLRELAPQIRTGSGPDNPKQNLAVLQTWEKGSEAQKSVVDLIKNLTIQGYMNSEYVMTNITHYELVPGRYHGCVPLKTT